MNDIYTDILLIQVCDKRRGYGNNKKLYGCQLHDKDENEIRILIKIFLLKEVWAMEKTETIFVPNIHTMTLTKKLTGKEKLSLQEILYKKTRNGYGHTYSKRGQVVSTILSDGGIGISLYHKRDSKGFEHNRIYLKVNLYNASFDRSRLKTFENTDENVSLLSQSIDDLLGCVFPPGLDTLNCYKIDRIDLCRDVRLTKELCEMYMRFSKGGYTPGQFNKVYRFDEVSKRKKVDPKRIVLDGDSMQIIVYDKEHQLKASGIEDLDSDCAKGFIRFEMPLNGKWLKRKIKERNKRKNDIHTTLDVFTLLREESGEWFFKYFNKVFQEGHYRTLKKAREIVESSGFHRKTKKRMLRVLELCSKHLSLDVAFGHMLEDGEIHHKDILPLLKHFGELKLNPITIPVRWKEENLPSVCELIATPKTESEDKKKWFDSIYHLIEKDFE